MDGLDPDEKTKQHPPTSIQPRVGGPPVPLSWYVTDRGHLPRRTASAVSTHRIARGEAIGRFLGGTYQFAWDQNCERLDYTPAEKARIKVKILAASGELARLRAESAEIADRLRAEKKREAIKVQPRRADGKVDKPSGTSAEVPLGKPSKKKSPRVAKEVARQAGVSVSTAERALREHDREQEGKPVAPKPPPKPKPRTVTGCWEMPHQLGRHFK